MTSPVGYKIKKLMKEGYKHKQAVAIALKMNEKGCLGPRGGKMCFGKKQFLFNPKNPKKSFDVYIDKNPKDTIKIKYKTYSDTVKTIRKLERLYKSNRYTHKRIKQVAMILMVRLRVLKKKKKKSYLLAKKYHDFLSKRTKTNKKDRKKLKFNI
tara:strand:- start:274 stop:735 length:462 start_codon:yes stop_codon:yes gene_type:complete